MMHMGLGAYAEALILSHGREVDFSTVTELAYDYLGYDISDADAEKVQLLMERAMISITFPHLDDL